MIAEAVLLGCCILDPANLDKAHEAGVCEDHFTEPDRQLLWRTFVEIRSHNKTIDLLTISLALGKNCPFTEFASCEESAPTHLNFKSSLEAVLWARKRYLLKVAALHLTSQLDAGTQQDGISEAIAGVVSIISDARDNKAPDMEAASRSVEQTLQDAIDGKPDLRKTFPLPLECMDRLLGKVYSHEFVLVGARPSVGKTSFAIQWASECGRQGYKVGYIATEMSAEQIISQMAGQNARVNWRNLYEEMPDSLKKAKAFAQSIRTSKRLKIYDRDLSIQAIRRRCNALAGWADVVFIDHLAQISNPGKSRYESVSDTCHQMVEIQKALGCPLVLCHQLKRLETNAVPGLQDLRDSGAAEEDASRILLIHFPNENHQGIPQIGLNIDPPETRDYYVIQAKHRYGVRDVSVRCKYHAPTTRFLSV